MRFLRLISLLRLSEPIAFLSFAEILETFSIRQTANRSFAVAKISNFSKAFSSVQFSSFLFSQNIIQYKKTNRNCKVEGEPRRNQKTYEA